MPEEEAGLFNLGGRGGNVIFTPGTGSHGGPDGDFVFNLADGTEFMRICHNGDCFVKGEKVTNSHAIFAGFKRWCQHAGVFA